MGMKHKSDENKNADPLPTLANQTFIGETYEIDESGQVSAPIGINRNTSKMTFGHIHCGPVRKPVLIKNLNDQSNIKDTLHHQSRALACTRHSCVAALMRGQQALPDELTMQEIYEQAVDLVKQYFTFHKKSDNVDDELTCRIKEIHDELDKYGTYTMKTEELHFACRTAWRNASRCIGRIHWQNLDLFDCRHVKTTKEMFDAICRHIKHATNNGNIRSTITVFPQRVKGREDFRIWNPQLVSFAGYTQPDGSIIGDPARAKFTQICQKLGWRGKGGRFDVLPIVVSAPDEGVKLYEIPEDLVVLVDIEHPDYPWFASLGLKWYALPAVSDMALEAGGLIYTGIPFNGWFMGTEIGARDLSDCTRYNILGIVARKMGLDIGNTSSLWKDKVLVEVNIAVLHSFRKKRITVVDHHTASELFMKHLKNEANARGGCPADWVWIVPPISASTTEVFHQEMINYNLKPSFHYQVKAWETYNWPESNIKLRYGLKTTARLVYTCVKAMHGLASKRPHALILFATETGRSETMANKLSRIMGLSFNVEVHCMEDISFADIIDDGMLLIVASSYGNGEAPENGKKFWNELFEAHNSQLDTHSKPERGKKFKKLYFGVFALGSSQYPTFCAFGVNLDKSLEVIGGQRLVEVGYGDEMRDMEKAFKEWAKNVYQKACNKFNLPCDIQRTSIVAEDQYDAKLVRVVDVGFIESNVLNDLCKMHKRKKIFPSRVLSISRLKPKTAEKQTLLVRLTASNDVGMNFLRYKPGDHLGIFPANPPVIVDEILCHLKKQNYDDQKALQVQIMIENTWENDCRLPPATLRIALTQYLDVTSAPSQKFLSYLAKIASDERDCLQLNKLANDNAEYRKWLDSCFPTLADVLKKFPSIHIDPEFLLTQLPLLQPRYYSISSSPLVYDKEIHLTMSVVNFGAPDIHSPKRFGVCTGFFDRSPTGDIPVFIREATNFRMPEDSTIPLILICAGSGIAPFRAFWQERDSIFQSGASCGKMFLFFGCRTDIDYIFGHELSILTLKGVINKIFIAFSRKSGNEKRYVQDEVFLQRKLVSHLINNEKAHVYVCGDACMADGVRKSMVRVFEEEAKLATKEANKIMQDLINSGRYHEDIYKIASKGVAHNI